MATKTVNQPDHRARDAGASAPEFITSERIDLAILANVDAAYCADGALHILQENLAGTEEGETVAVLCALLLRMRALCRVTGAALGDQCEKLEDLQRAYAGGRA